MLMPLSSDARQIITNYPKVAHAVAAPPPPFPPPRPAPRSPDIWSRGQRRQCTLAGLQMVFYRMAKEKLPNFHETLYQNIAKETCVLELRRNTLPTVILSCSCLQEVLHSKHSFFLTGFLWERHGFVSGSKNSN